MPRESCSKNHLTRSFGFTLIELIVVILIIGLVSTLVVVRSGTYTRLQEESFLRRLSETIVFLHHQAVADQAFYALEFDLKKNLYKVGVMRPDSDVETHLKNISPDVGNLSLELASFLHPSLGRGQTLIAPPAFPSLGEPQEFPADAVVEDIRTSRGKDTPDTAEKVYVLFSPRGFSEFAVIHLKLKNARQITLLVNPFTGLTEIFREYKDFEWTYGKKKNDA